jgi:hypothetical protein
MAVVDWLVSSRVLATQSLTIDGGAEDVTFANGGAYLLHTTAALDICARLTAALTAAGVTTPSVFVTEARYVRITAGATFTLNWGAATNFRDLLGFTGNLAAAASYTAPNRSPLLYSAGKIWRPELAPLGAHGQPVSDITATFGPNGRQVVREEGEASVVQRFSAQHIALDRYWSAPPAVTLGDLRYFWASELLTNQRFVVLRRVSEGTSTTTSASYGSSPVIGPYRADLSDKDMRRFQFDRSSGFDRVEAYYDYRLPVVQCDEFEA